MAESNKDLRRRLDRAEGVVEALRGGQADAVVGKDGVLLLRLREMEEQLRRSEERFRLASEAAGLGVFEWDVLADAPRWVNDRMFEIFGRTREEGPLTRADFVAGVLHPDDVVSFEQAIARAQQNDRRFHFTCRIRRSSDGRQRWIEYSGRFDGAPDGALERLIGVIEDVTDRKEAEAALKDLNRTLEERVEARTVDLEETIARLRGEAARREQAEQQLRHRSDELEVLNAELRRRATQLRDLAVELSTAEDRERRRIAEVLHDDLQQTLVGVRFQLDMVRRWVGEHDQAGDMLGQITTLVDDAVEKTQGLSHDLAPPALFRNGLVAGLQWLAEQMETQYGLAVDLDLDEAAEPASELLKPFLYKAVRELLFNVVKHAGIGRAAVAMKRDDRQLVLSVRDEGKGFDPAALGSGEGKPGFGLMNIQERVAFLGGRLNVHAEPGWGSTFEIVLPAETARLSGGDTNGKDRDGMTAHGDGNVQTAGQAGTDAEPARRTRVLLVDDHKIMREGLGLLLEDEADLELVGEADNGKQAVDLAGRLRPDVIVMDVSMPVMNGVEATRIIKREFPGIRVVGLSMYERDDMARDMLDAGAETHLVKTGRPDELLAAVRGGGPEA
ncbi:MAG: response regulator [Phycisphaerae bacterium]